MRILIYNGVVIIKNHANYIDSEDNNMPRYKEDINNIYISERMQEALRKIEEYKLTTITAPMGYGKTTAALWYLNNRKEYGDLVFRINIYSDDVNLLWHSVRTAFAGTEFGDRLAEMNFPIGKMAISLFIQTVTSYLLQKKKKIYLLIDDCHLITDKTVPEIVLALCDIPCEHFHIILISRSTLLLASEEFRLGNRLYKITLQNMKLNLTELSIYCRRCGANLNDEDLRELFFRSEGWISYIYLNLRHFTESGNLLREGDDIYTMIAEALLSHRNEEMLEFLLAMCIAEEFTAKEAEYIVGSEYSAEWIHDMLRQNAFIRFLPDTKTFRFHHMLRECVKKQFDKLPLARQKHIHTRYGEWNEMQKQYIKAIRCYEAAEDMSSALRVIGLDRGVEIACVPPNEILLILEKSTEEEMLAEPQALLVLMRRLFSWRQIPKMMEVKTILLKAAEKESLTEKERNNLLGECDLIMSFLGYNDIEAMSKLHQSACRLMTRPAISIEKNGSYTFGSPSVLMMFHRGKGQLDTEIATMNRAMPYYYQVAADQGKGAEQLMEAEALFNRGDFLDAGIMAEKAMVAATEKKQRYISLSCEFLSHRMAMFGNTPSINVWYQKKREEFEKRNDPMLFTTLDACMTYLSALTENLQDIPVWYAEGKLEEANLLGPARPMHEMIYNQVLLVQKKYVAVLGREEMLLGMCRMFPYLLCEIHLHIQLAIAYDALGKTSRGISEMETAFDLAMPDEIIIPFAENARAAAHLFEQMPNRYDEMISGIRSLCALIKNHSSHPNLAKEELTEQEFAVAKLSALGKTRKEIAGELFLSENTVRNYLGRIYDKLSITGTPKQKQYMLSEIMSDQTK